MKYFQFSLFSIDLWLMKNDATQKYWVDEFSIEILKVGDRALFGFYHETACAKVLYVLFFQFEFFKKSS